MRVKESYEIAQEILRKSGGSRDPDEICKCLGIELTEEFDLVNLKGMYSSAGHHRTIFLHSRLTGYLRRFVLAHEIAHDQIPEHRLQSRDTPHQDVQFFGGTNSTEREANSVAAHVLIDDKEMLNLIYEGKNIQTVAMELYVPEDLLLIELEDYRKMHPDFIINLPRTSRGNYLKDYTDGSF